MNQPAHIPTLVILVLTAIAYQLPGLFQPLVLYDEGIALCGAERILRGDIPYRDFWSMYAPGQFYTLALFFGVLGKTVLVERVYDLIVRCSISLVVFLILRQTVRSRLALGGWAVSVVWMKFFGSPGYTVYPFLLFFLVGVFFLRQHLAGTDRISAPMAGAAIGLSMLFRHFLGAMVAVLMLVSILSFFWARRFEGNPSKAPPGDASRISGHLPASFVLLVSAPFILVLSLLGIGGGLPDTVDQLFVFPLTKFSEFRSLPYPSLQLIFSARIESWTSLVSHALSAADVLVFYLFPALCVFGLVVNVGVWIREKRMSPTTAVGLYLSVAGLAFLKQASVRSELLHLLPCGLTAILVAFITYQQCSSSIRRKLWMRVASTCLAIFLVYPTVLWCQELSQLSFKTVAPVSDSYRMAVNFVKERAQGDDRVFVGVYNHDRIVANYVSLYFLFGRGYGTRYHELHPGVITTAEVQKEVVEEMERNNVDHLLLASGWWREPNRSQEDAGIDYLDDFIRSRFEPIMQFRDVSVWARRRGRPLQK